VSIAIFGKTDKITYLPIYMLMFIEKSNDIPMVYKIDLTGLNLNPKKIGNRKN